MPHKVRRGRSLPHRIVAFVFAIMFFFAGARESLAGYVCLQHGDHGSAVGSLGDPEHVAYAGDQIPTEPDHSGHAGHDRPAHEAGPLADASPAGQTPESDAGHSGHDGEPCSCLGDCQPGQSIVPGGHTPDAYVAYSFPAPERVTRVAAWLPGTPKFTLPPANGPPLIG